MLLFVLYRPTKPNRCYLCICHSLMVLWLDDVSTNLHAAKSANVAALTTFFLTPSAPSVNVGRFFLFKYFPPSVVLTPCVLKRHHRNMLRKKQITAYALRRQATVISSKSVSLWMADVNKMLSLSYLPCWSWRYLKGNAEYTYKQQCTCSLVAFA